MSLLGKSYGIGLHRYDPAKFPGAIFLDVADAQYNPLNPEEVVAGIHPAKRPGTYGIAKELQVPLWIPGAGFGCSQTPSTAGMAGSTCLGTWNIPKRPRRSGNIPYR